MYFVTIKILERRLSVVARMGGAAGGHRCVSAVGPWGRPAGCSEGSTWPSVRPGPGPPWYGTYGLRGRNSCTVSGGGGHSAGGCARCGGVCGNAVRTAQLWSEPEIALKKELLFKKEKGNSRNHLPKHWLERLCPAPGLVRPSPVQPTSRASPSRVPVPHCACPALFGHCPGA